MPSERIQRQIDRLLDEAEQAAAARDWATVHERVAEVLILDADNEDARALGALAERGLAAGVVGRGSSVVGDGTPNPAVGAQFIVPALPVGEGLVPSRLAPEPGASAEATDEPPGLRGSAAPSSTTTHDPHPTTFANRYKVIRFLGEGGKKQVYLAYDSLLDRDVAFALIKTEGLDETGRRRISREGQAMGALGAHPHIVTVFDLGELPAASGDQRATSGGPGQPYMVTELMKGGDVEGLIEKAPEHKLPLTETVRIADEVCQGLEFAHSKGIVHRDLKPGNVWLTEAVGSGQVGSGGGAGTTADSLLPTALAGTAKIGDFGLAVSLDRTRLTQAGMMVGTVGYMPPEQATGGQVTPRSDLYSLGAMLYEMVAGRPPFIGDDVVAIIGQHLNTAPVSPAWHRPDCPPGLEALILRLLEKDPSRRPESAAEVRQILSGLAGAMNHALTAGGGGASSLSLAGEGRGEGEGRDGRDAPAAPDNPLYRRAFVGREAELRQLTAAYDAAASGRGSLAMVVGEPGIGKTSVCEQLATYVAVRGGRPLVGHCYEEGSLSLPYLPFVEVMRTYVLQREPAGLKQDLGSGAGEVARIVSEVRDRVQVEPVAGGDPDEDRWRLLQAVTGFLRAASLVQPLILVLEDLHDADRGTLDLLVHLARNLDGARLLIIGTYRDVEVDRSHPLSSALAELRRGQNFLRVPLRGLTAEEVQRMMAAVAQREIPWPFAELVHRQTEGNPLFVQEMLRYLVEEGLVAEREGALRRVGDDSLVGRIPEGLRDVIGKRLSRLSEQTNQVLSIASVIGREFRLDVLQRVGNLSDEAVEAALEEAAAIAVAEQRTGVGGQVSFRFTHAFFRQTLYEELFAARRIRLHQQVARALEAVYGRRVEEHAAELAEHYSNSSDPEDLRKAVSYGEMAAQRSMSVFAYGEAARHYENALKAQEVLDPDDAARCCDLLLALCEALLPQEEPARVASGPAEQAFALAEGLGDNTRAAKATVLALEGLERGTQIANTLQAARDAQPWAERADRCAAEGTRERVLADVYIGVSRIQAVGPAVGQAYLHRAAAAAFDTSDQEVFYKAAAFAIRLLQALRYRDFVQSVADRFTSRPRQGARIGDLGTGLAGLASARLQRGDRDAAEQAWSELAELAMRTRDIQLLAASQVDDLVRARLDGRLTDAASIAEGVYAYQVGQGVNAQALARELQVLVHLGRGGEVLERPDVINPRGRPARAFATWCLASAGRCDESRSLREQFGDVADDQDESTLSILAFLLDAAVLCGDRDFVRPLARRLAVMSSFACNNALLSWPRILGGAAALLGEREQARTLYEQAIESSTKIRNRPELALTHLELAELLLGKAGAIHRAATDETESDPGSVGASASGGPLPSGPEPGASATGGQGARAPRDEAMRHLDIAIAEFREMKMQPALERALRHKELLHA